MGASGTRAVENLRLVMGELQIADVKAQVGLSLFADFEDFSIFKPAPQQEKSVNAMLDQVIAWGGVLKTLREKRALGGAESAEGHGIKTCSSAPPFLVPAAWN